jgi:sugar lactone lactonase YvrE
VYAGAVLLALIVGVGLWNPFGQATATSNQVPRFVVDPFWPKPLPSDPVSGKPWVTGEVGGTCVDSNDHVFSINRAWQPTATAPNQLISPETVIAVPSPPVIEYDPKGNVVNAWPTNPSLLAKLPGGIHGCFVDYQDNVWIGGNGDGIVQKWTHDGSRMLLQIGTKGVCDWPANNNACGNSGSDPTANKSTTLLNEPADIAIDPTNGDIYIADGYGNHRVVVFNAHGTYLRQWGSPGSGPGQFAAGDGGHPHCVVISNDGLVYACDRGQDRIQVFDKMGNLQRIIPVIPGTGTPGLGTAGSAWDVDFSPDKKQQNMYEADGGNEIVWIFDRALGTILGGFGGPGRQAGDFTFLHTISTDSKGNLYTGETVNGRRIQRFTLKGSVSDKQLEPFTPASGAGTFLHYDPVP